MKAVPKTETKINKLLDELKEKINWIFKDNLVQIILYGSYARNEQTSESDVDIIILTNLDIRDFTFYEESITKISVDLSLKYDLVVQILLKNASQYNKYLEVLPFYKNIRSEGKVIYG